MTASDHLGQQFEVVHPHRTIRVGEKTYPAVYTSQPGDDFHHAVIPTENGGLWGVGGFSANNHMQISGPKYSLTAPEDRPDVVNHDVFGEVGSAHGVQDFHSSMDRLSTHKLDPEAVSNNQRLIKEHYRLASMKDG